MSELCSPKFRRLHISSLLRASPVGGFSLFYLISPYRGPFSTALVVCCWLASRESTGRCQIDTVSSRANKPTARVTIAAERRALSPRGRTETRALDSEPLHIAYAVNGKEKFLVPKPFLRRPYRAFSALGSDQIQMILPGFRIPSASTAIFIVRMTLTASPCSAIRKSILP